jgi:hypothetical protein
MTHFDSGIGPNNDAIYLRKSEWEDFQRDLHAYRAAGQAESDRQQAGAPSAAIGEDDQRILEVCGCRLMTCVVHSRILL